MNPMAMMTLAARIPEFKEKAENLENAMKTLAGSYTSDMMPIEVRKACKAYIELRDMIKSLDI